MSARPLGARLAALLAIALRPAAATTTPAGEGRDAAGAAGAVRTGVEEQLGFTRKGDLRRAGEGRERDRGVHEGGGLRVRAQRPGRRAGRADRQAEHERRGVRAHVRPRHRHALRQGLGAERSQRADPRPARRGRPARLRPHAARRRGRADVRLRDRQRRLQRARGLHARGDRGGVRRHAAADDAAARARRARRGDPRRPAHGAGPGGLVGCMRAATGESFEDSEAVEDTIRTRLEQIVGEVLAPGQVAPRAPTTRPP